MPLVDFVSCSHCDAVLEDDHFRALWRFERKTLRKRVRVHLQGRGARESAAVLGRHQTAAAAGGRVHRPAVKDTPRAKAGPVQPRTPTTVQTPAEAFLWGPTHVQEKTRLAESWLQRSSSFLSPALRLSTPSLAVAPPPVPLLGDANNRGLVGWLIALHNSLPLPAVPVYADADTRIGRSSECELSVPASARHTSRLHAVVRYSSAHKGWWLHTCGKHGVVAGPHSTAIVPPQKGWMELGLVAHCFGVAEDNLQITVVPITETSLFQSVRSLVMDPQAGAPTLPMAVPQ